MDGIRSTATSLQMLDTVSVCSYLSVAMHLLRTLIIFENEVDVHEIEGLISCFNGF